MCMLLTSITFPVIWSSVLISVTREWRHCGLVYKFFLINNIELKCSFVWCLKYHTSWSNGTAELHFSVDLLCGTTAAELHNSVDLLCDTTAAELHKPHKFTLWPEKGCRATQLSRFTLWHKGSPTKPGLMHAPGIAQIFQRQWWTTLKVIKA